MGDFAVIGEGYTDQIVIKNIIIGYFQDYDELLVNFEQPPLDRTSSSPDEEPGGWTLVKRYFEERKFLQALQFNKYLVIHIDTDIAADFGISLIQDGRQLTDDELLDQVEAKFQEYVGPEIWTSSSDRFLFAIGFNSIECWLLPLVFDKSKKITLKKTTGCLEAIDHERRKKKQTTLSRPHPKKPDSYQKNSDTYKELSRSFTKRNVVEKYASNNRAFTRFLQQLAKVQLP